MSKGCIAPRVEWLPGLGSNQRADFSKPLYLLLLLKVEKSKAHN